MRSQISRLLLCTALALAAFIHFTPESTAREALGMVRGRVIGSTGEPISGIRVATRLDRDSMSEAITADDGTFAIRAYLGRRSLKWKAGLNLFGITTKTKTKIDIRTGEIELEIGHKGTEDAAASITVPIFFADLDNYTVYLCDVELTDEGDAAWVYPHFFDLMPIKLSEMIVREGNELVIELPVNVPPYPELAGSLRVVVNGGVFKKGFIKAFDDGGSPDEIAGDGVYTASFTIPKKGPFGFFIVTGSVMLPELSAVFEPGNAWPLMITTISTQEAEGHISRLTQVYSLGGTEVGLSAEWYYYSNDDDDWRLQSAREFAAAYAKHHWYSLFARSRLDKTAQPLFVCRGMKEFRAAMALGRMIERYDTGDLDGAGRKLEEARRVAPEYESISLWDARLKHARGDIAGAIDVLEDENAHASGKSTFIVLAELYREAGRASDAVDAYVDAFNASRDPYILRTLANYLYELEEYTAAQYAYDNLKRYAASLPYRFNFLLSGSFDFNKRFSRSSLTAEQLLFTGFAPPADVWMEDLFEEAYILGSLCGWKAALKENPEHELSSSEAKKYSVMLRLAGELDYAGVVASTIPGAEGALEMGLIELELAVRALKAAEIEKPSYTQEYLGHIERAKKHFGRSIMLDKEFFDGYFLRALTAYLDGNPEGALPDVERALELDPYHREARFLIARACEETGRMEQAIQHWQWFVDDCPEGALKIVAAEHLLNIKSVFDDGNLDE